MIDYLGSRDRFSSVRDDNLFQLHYAVKRKPSPGYNQARSQEVAKGGEGLFGKLEITVNELDPNFYQSWIRLRQFFCQNPVISKKKVFTKTETVFPA